jgi:hypothetical protein
MDGQTDGRMDGCPLCFDGQKTVSITIILHTLTLLSWDHWIDGWMDEWMDALVF